MEKDKDKKSKIMLLYADGIPYGTYKHKTDKWFLMIHYLRKFRLMEAYFSSVAAPEMEGVFAAPGLITPNFRMESSSLCRMEPDIIGRSRRA